MTVVLYISCWQRHPTATQVTEIINLLLLLTIWKTYRVYVHGRIKSSSLFNSLWYRFVISQLVRLLQGNQDEETRRCNETPTFQSLMDSQSNIGLIPSSLSAVPKSEIMGRVRFPIAGSTRHKTRWGSAVSSQSHIITQIQRIAISLGVKYLQVTQWRIKA